jgi:hypothetical protein
MPTTPQLSNGRTTTFHNTANVPLRVQYTHGRAGHHGTLCHRQ